ncbi:unnamed protein product [Arctogadus glacialis]
MGIHNRTSAHNMNQMESMGHHSIRSEFLEVSPMQRHPKQFSKGPLKTSLTSDLVNSELHEGFKDFIQHSIRTFSRKAVDDTGAHKLQLDPNRAGDGAELWGISLLHSAMRVKSGRVCQE